MVSIIASFSRGMQWVWAPVILSGISAKVRIAIGPPAAQARPAGAGSSAVTRLLGSYSSAAGKGDGHAGGDACGWAPAALPPDNGRPREAFEAEKRLPARARRPGWLLCLASQRSEFLEILVQPEGVLAGAAGRKSRRAPCNRMNRNYGSGLLKCPGCPLAPLT